MQADGDRIAEASPEYEYCFAWVGRPGAGNLARRGEERAIGGDRRGVVHAAYRHRKDRGSNRRKCFLRLLRDPGGVITSTATVPCVVSSGTCTFNCPGLTKETAAGRPLN